jgi:uncharacterized protein
MPVTPTYPGVYVEEIPSGVRTITGVGTSVTAFVGSAKRGPINKAVHVLGFSDFERRFGGLQSESFMSYAVKQFFLNGGSDAWVVRVAKITGVATKPLQNDAQSPIDVLQVTAIDEGKSGNDIELRVDYQTGNPASTFNLVVNYSSADNPGDSTTEKFDNLSMNSADARYVEDLLATSQLVKVKRVVPQATLSNLIPGTSVSGDLADLANLVDPTHKEFRISVNGLPPITIQLALPTDINGPDPLDTLCKKIQSSVQAVGGDPALSQFQCAPEGGVRIKMTSGAGGEFSSVRVLPGNQNDATARLELGTLNGGIETDAVAAIRPRETPEHGTLMSGEFMAALTVPDTDHTSFQISLDGYGPDTVSLGTAVAAGSPVVKDQLTDLANRIQTAVRALKPANPAYSNFTCKVIDDNKLVLASGSRGVGSSVVVSNAAAKSIADSLNLLSGSMSKPGTNFMLLGGNEYPFTDAEAYNLYIGDRAARKGIYALEAVDLFNLLCLPGITDSGILMDANSYCKERRAFMIVDAPPSADQPDEMVKTINSTALPKSDSAAVYYPWIKVADPLKGGKLRSFPPSGTIAGLYARTDGARGVWKAPAGTEATLLGVQGLDYLLTDRENGTLNPLGVNCVRILSVYGAIAWGARTLRGADQMTSEWKYIPIRRLALYIEESLFRGTQWVVFEPNDEPLWSQIRLNVGAFMHTLFRQGAFQGSTPRDAYFVKCDKETTTQDDINRGVVNILVGFAPLKPAEFVIVRIQQIAGQIQV